jgi:hypothetical protein
MKSIKGFVPSRQESSFKAESSSKRNLSFGVFEAIYLFLVSGSSIPLGDHGLYYSRSDNDQSGDYYCERDLPDGKGTICLKYALRARASAPHCQDSYLVYEILPSSYVVLPSLFNPFPSLDNPFVSDAQQAAEGIPSQSPSVCPPASACGAVVSVDDSRGVFGEKLNTERLGRVSQPLIEHKAPTGVLTPVDIDTIALSVYGEFDNNILDELEAFKEQAKLFDGDFPCSGRFEGWSIRPFGISSLGMSYYLKRGDLVAMAGRGSGEKAANFRLEIGSVTCHDSDKLVLVAGLYGLFGLTVKKEIMSRGDLCRDAAHDLSEYRMHVLDSHNWYWNRRVKWQVYFYGDTFTGFQFGRGGVVMRGYDKGFELLDDGNCKKTNFFQNYFNVDFLETVQDEKTKEKIKKTVVWRLEYQLRREYLRSVGVNTLADFLLKKDEMWSYLVQEWVFLSTGNVVRSNGHGSAKGSPMHECWKVYLNDAVPITRCAPVRSSSGTDRVMRQGIGCLFSYALKEIADIGSKGLSDVFEDIKDYVQYYLDNELFFADIMKKNNKSFRKFQNFVNANTHLEPVPF